MKLLMFLLLFAVCFKSGAQTFDSKTLGDIKARWLGPAVMSGRVSCLDVVNNDGKTMYIGSASGGLWKSEDFGVSFKPVFDKYNQSIGAVTINQKDPGTIWVGTGESWVRNSVSIGDGIYKSSDAGQNWTRMGLDSSERIARIIIHDKNPETVFAAVTGALWSDSKHRGVYKTTDGGKSWEQILYVDEKTGCADLAVDPSNPDVLYAAMWQFRRTPYSFASGGPGSALYKSTDGGKSWKKLSKGLPGTEMGRIAIGVSPVNPNILFATVEYEKTAMFKSGDQGESWTRKGTNFHIIERPFYFSRLWCDPKDTNIVYKAGFNLQISRDGGNSFASAGGGHGDDHDLWINPNNPNQLVLGTDGGLYISNNQGSSYYLCRSLPIGQFYHVMYDMEEPYNVYGGLQDNFSWYGPSRNNTGGVASKHWDPMSYGDGFWTFPDPSDRNTAYSEIQGGVLIRYDKERKILKELSPHPGPDDPKYRFNWNTPFCASIHNPKKLFVGAQFVFVSYDQAETWKKISPDLTTNNPKYQQQENSGGITADNSAAENHCTLFYIAESPADSNTIWAGTDDGNIQLTRDGGKTWTKVSVNLKDAPAQPWVTCIEPSRFQMGTAYVTLDYHNWGNMNPYVYKTTDFGNTWSKISNDSIRGFCHVVREDLQNPNLLFTGTEKGLYLTIDGGQSWAQMNHNNNIPSVPVRDIRIHPRDNEVIIGSHGRSIMIIDALGLEVLRGLNKDIMQSKFSLLAKPEYVIPLGGFDFSYQSEDEFTGSNPNSDPVIAYFLKDRQLVGEFKVEVLDAEGSLVNSAPAGKHKGVNIVSLPITRKPPRVPPAPRAAFGAITGHALTEGSYPVRIIRNKDTVMTQLVIKQEASSPYSASDRKARLQALDQVYTMLNDFTYTVDAATTLRDDAKKLSGSLPAGDKLKKQLDAMAHDLDTLHRYLVNTKEGAIVSENANRLRENLTDVYGTINGYEGKPSISSLDRIRTLKGEMAEADQALDSILKKYLPKINNELQKRKLPEMQKETREVFDLKA